MSRNMRVNQDEEELLETLRAQPTLLARVKGLVELTRVESARTLSTADEIEDQVAESVRDLGREVISGWAQAAEEQVAIEMRRQQPRARVREKKACSGTPPSG